MKSQYNKVYLLIATLLVSFATAGTAQVSKTSYFMETSTSRQYMNPALSPDQGYFGFPFLNNIYADVRTNTFNLDNFTFDKGGPERVLFMNPLVSADEFMKNISQNNYASTELNLTLLSAGWYKGDAFWNVNLGVRHMGDVNIAGDALELMKVGFNKNSQTTYNFGNTNLTANAFVELGLSYARPFLDKSLTVGLRTKFLVGAADIDFNIDNLELEGGPKYWRTKSFAKMQASAPGIKAKYKINDVGTEVFDGFDYDEDGFNVAGYGAGIDLGAEYRFNKIGENFDGILKTVFDRLTVSAALTDIGFINWNKDNSVILNSPETESYFSPNTDLKDGESSLEDAFDEFMDEMENALELQGEKNKSRTSRLAMGLNMGAEYELLKEKITAGFLYSSRFGKYHTVNEYTFSANFRPCPWFATSLSYSFAHSAFDTFGFAMHLAPSKGISLFLATDYLTPHVNSDWIPTTAKAVNFQLGITIPLGARKVKM